MLILVPVFFALMKERELRRCASLVECRAARVVLPKRSCADSKRVLTLYLGTGFTLEVARDGEKAMALKIGELSERGEVNLQTIRYYEREGLLPEPPRLSSAYRSTPTAQCAGSALSSARRRSGFR